MSTVIHYPITPEISATLLIHQGECRLVALEDALRFGRSIPIPEEIEDRTFPTRDEAIHFIKEFYRSRSNHNGGSDPSSSA